jgi:hypothetical protein
METSKISNGPMDSPHYFISEWFDFVSSDFNRATFNSQRALWQERDYTDYEGAMSLITWYNSNSEAPSYYLCRFIVKAGKDPEAVWFEGDDWEIPFEGALPEDFPSVYTIDGIYDYILAVIENLALRAKEGNEEFSVYISYDSLFNIPSCVQIKRLENEIPQAIRTIQIDIRPLPAVEEPPVVKMSAFDRETFEQEYQAWKALGVKNYRYSLSIHDSFMDKPESVKITIRNGKEPQVSGDASFLEDYYSIDGVFAFISSMLEAPSFSGCDFSVAYWPGYHIPVKLQVEDMTSTFKLLMTLDSFEILTR